MANDGKAAVWLIADDYGLSPAVSAAIRRLIGGSRLSGTGCMTLFDQWREEAARLKECPGIEQAAVGLHLTLTDFGPLTGEARFAANGRMPALKTLLGRCHEWSRLTPFIHAELDAQLDAFGQAMSHMPHYIDGHQHVHFLSSVRSWLWKKHELFARAGSIPWLRGAPAIALGGSSAVRAKISVVRLLATGFDASMKRCGYPVKGPLSGFYDWMKPDDFIPAMRRLRARAGADSVVMCHPGEVDAVLRQRDGLVAARPVELAALLDAPLFSLRQRSSAVN